MAAINPKLEFFRLPLKHRKGESKTFRDFAIDVLGASVTISDENAFKKIFEEFIKNINSGFQNIDKLQKTITLISKKTVNKHLDKKPSMKTGSFVFKGVINGGPYGKDRILADLVDKENSEHISKTKPVLSYYYIFVYIPSDHTEGFFMVHSNNNDDTITNAFRYYITSFFNKSSYRKPVVESFCPQKFQDQFKDGATMQNISFKSTFMEDTAADNPISEMFNNYTIEIKAIPKNKDISLDPVQSIKGEIEQWFYGKEGSITPLSKFDKVSLSAKNTETKTSKTFEWNTRDNSFVPVVYLENNVILNEDKTPNFEDLERYCFQIFNNDILKEIRPDLYVEAFD